MKRITQSFFVLFLIISLFSCGYDLNNSNIVTKTDMNYEDISMKENFDGIEYRNDIDYINKYFKALEDSVVEAYWKYFEYPSSVRIGPSNFVVSGFIKVSEEEVEKIEGLFTFIEAENNKSSIDFPNGISPDITGCSDFDWRYSKDFNKWIVGGTWIGEAFYDINNKIIYVYVGIN